MLFRVHGTLAMEVEIVGGTKSNSKLKQFELAGEDGQQLHCTFMEIDREVANVKKGQRVEPSNVFFHRTSLTINRAYLLCVAHSYDLAQQGSPFAYNTCFMLSCFDTAGLHLPVLNVAGL